MKLATLLGITLCVAMSAALATVACNNGSSSSSAGGGTTTAKTTSAPTATQAAADVKEVFKSRCAPCHGDSGKGDGPGAAALTPKPHDYTNAAWQDSVKDEDIKKTILYGGATVGKSPAMPANQDLDGKPELDALVTYIRSFKGK